METKKCKKCGETKSISLFKTALNCVGGYSHSCKDCANKHRRDTFKYPPADITNKVCIRCNIEKPVNEFFLSKYHLDGYYSYCKSCKREYQAIKKYPKKYTEKRKIKLQKDEVYRERVNTLKRIDYRKHISQRMWCAAKERAKRKGYSFDIEISDIVIPEKCPILNEVFIPGTKDNYEYTPSLDRIVPELGYVKGNIQVISKKANSMKNSASIKELKLFSKWVNDTFV